MFDAIQCEVCHLWWDVEGFVPEDREVECPDCGATNLFDYSLSQIPRWLVDEAC